MVLNRSLVSAVATLVRVTALVRRSKSSFRRPEATRVAVAATVEVVIIVTVVIFIEPLEVPAGARLGRVVLGRTPVAEVVIIIIVVGTSRLRGQSDKRYQQACKRPSHVVFPFPLNPQQLVARRSPRPVAARCWKGLNAGGVPEGEPDKGALEETAKGSRNAGFPAEDR
jgi:hypothetical protein